MSESAEITLKLSSGGYFVSPRILCGVEVSSIIGELLAALNANALGDVLRSRGKAYAARNLVVLWPPALEVAIQSEIVRILSAIMGSDFGLVQAIYFDKPPDLPWSLPWHQDVAIAVKEHRIQSRRFGAPTVKQGVPHVEADAELLETMVTVRIHLDDVTEENGPLEVIPGSHRRGLIPSSFSPDPGEGRKVLLNAGDALLMRPLLLHHSGSSKRGTNLHRRLLHFEYAPSPFLSDGYEWHNFIAADKKTDRSISCNHGGTANH